MFDLDSLSLVHARLHDGLLRVARLQMWAIIPLALAVFAVMAWWGAPAAAVPLAPLTLLVCLLSLAAMAGYALVVGHEVGVAARELSAVHNQVLYAVDQEEADDAVAVSH